MNEIELVRTFRRAFITRYKPASGTPAGKRKPLSGWRLRRVGPDRSYARPDAFSRFLAALFGG